MVAACFIFIMYMFLSSLLNQLIIFFNLLFLYKKFCLRTSLGLVAPEI